MKRQILKTALILGSLTLGSLALPAAMSVASAATQVNINVNIGPPPPVIVHSAPTMVYLAEPGLYAAVGVPYDIFFFSGRYYYLRGNDWFWGGGYGGPWTYIEYKALPPGFRKYKVERLKDYREKQYVIYRQEGTKYKGQHFAAVEGKHDNGNSQGNGNGSNGNGNGKGKKDK